MTGPSAKASVAPRGSGFLRRIDGKPVSNEVEFVKLLSRRQQAAKINDHDLTGDAGVGDAYGLDLHAVGTGSSP